MPWRKKIEVAIILQVLFPENPFNPQGNFFINEFFDRLAIFPENPET
jgi:hypothetical protein